MALLDHSRQIGASYIGSNRNIVANPLPDLLIPGLPVALLLTVEPNLNPSRALRFGNALRGRRNL